LLSASLSLWIVGLVSTLESNGCPPIHYILMCWYPGFEVCSELGLKVMLISG
jgi:hypothetical protein